MLVESQCIVVVSDRGSFIDTIKFRVIVIHPDFFSDSFLASLLIKFAKCRPTALAKPTVYILCNF